MLPVGLAQHLAGSHIPRLHRLPEREATASRDDCATIRGESKKRQAGGHPTLCGVDSLEALNFLCCGQIPNANRVLRSGGCESLPIGRECHWVSIKHGLPVKPTQFSAGGEIPDPYRAVKPGGSNMFTIGRKRNPGNQARMGGELV